MGIDITGWVEGRDASLDEVLEEPLWFGVIDLNPLVAPRNSSVFGQLFGVRNYSDFAPIAPVRGLPPYPSARVEEEGPREYHHSHTWVTWKELQAVDWDEMALSGCAYGYRGGEEDWSICQYLDRSDPRRVAGARWTERDLTYRVEKETRREALCSGWRLLFDLMARLAEVYGDDCVHLVVWFYD